MHNMKRSLILLVALLVICSCRPPWRQTYLFEGINRLTMDEVAMKLGPPDSTMTLEDGSIIWKYQYRSSHTRGVYTDTYGKVHGGGGSSVCVEYILIFDKEKVLRKASRQGC